MSAPLKLGILTWRKGSYVEELAFFTHLAKEAESLNMEVFLFSPVDQLGTGKIRALFYEPKQGWRPRICSEPDIVYDRFRNMQPQAFRQFVQFRNGSRLTFINSRLAHKWNVHRYLQTYPSISKWLPETLPLDQPADALTMLKRHSSIYIKPVNGTGGKGILALTAESRERFHALGRNRQRRKIKAVFNTTSSLLAFISKWTNDTKYIVQQGLNLEWQPGVVTDFRLLVQKNGQGKWSITGLGGKIGSLDSATSNLHGGGKAIQPEQFLKRFLPEDKRLALYDESKQLGYQVSEYLEERFGRLVELGIDLGIDTAGRLWIIEVNPKPGRDIFRQMGDHEAYRKAVRNPLEYAKYVYERG